MPVVRPKFIQSKVTTLLAPLTDADVLEILLTSLVDLYGNQITMADLGATGYMTFEPGTDNEEIVSFSDFTINDDGTVSIDTDIVRGVAGVYPYDNSGTPRNHAGGSVVVFSNSPSVYEAILAYVEEVAISGAPNASLTTKGIVEMATTAEINAGAVTGSTGADLAVRPDQLAASLYALQLPTANEKAAFVGASGTPPSGANPFVDAAALAAQNLTPSGSVIPYAGILAPTGWLLADGSAISRATYATLFSILNPSLGVFTVTLASPGVFSLVAHGLKEGDTVYLTTTGALPTGLAANTRYYVIATGLTADAFELSATRGGSAINTSVSQSGVHTLHRTVYGLGDGSTTFNIPNLAGKVPVGRDTTDPVFAAGETGGEKTHTLITAEMPAHTHTTPYGNGSGGSILSGGTNNLLASPVSGSTGGDGAHNNLQPYLAMQFIIKT